MIYMLIILCIIVVFVICFLVPFHYKQCRTVTYNEITPEEIAELQEIEEQKEISRLEKIEILDNALIKYNRLLSSLKQQYKLETNEKKKAAILSKQISTLEKLNRTIEKREKLD